MQISDVRVKLINVSAERLKAVCTVTFDDEFVVRDVKVVDGTNGLFVAMPSRKLSVHCPACKHKNHLRARFCNECGAKVPPARAQAEDNGRSRLHRDIAHPITVEFREVVQQRVIEAYLAEVEKAGQPGYQPDVLEPEADAEPVARRAEPVVRHVEEPEEPAAELSEYDAMIAALRGSGPDDGADRAEPSRDGRRDRGPAPERGNARVDRGRERAPVRRDGGDRGNRADGPPRRDAERSDGRRGSGARGSDSRRNAPPRQDAPARQQTPARREPVSRSESRPPAEERPRTERAVAQPTPALAPSPAPVTRSAPARVEPKPKPQPVVSTPVQEDDGGFGQGIL